MKINNVERMFRQRKAASPKFRRTLAAIFAMLLMALTGTTLVQAQESFQVDQQESIARLSLGAGSNAIEVGLARVSGVAVLEGIDTVGPSVRLTIAPENSPTDDPQLTFVSKRSTTTQDGKLAVIGDLTVTRIERSATAEPNEAYHGPEYGDPVVSRGTQEVRLVFTSPVLSNPSLAAESGGGMELSGAIVASREGFPALLDAISESAWPSALVNDEVCSAPANVGEDYHGASCTGTVVASISNRVVSTGGIGGEGFYGFRPVAAPDLNHATIVLDLKLAPASSVSTAAMGAAASR